MGIETSDDAGVYLLDAERALVQTLDVITPVVDDPADFGAIAAINALSDIYAMGGEPLTAISFMAFDPCRLDVDVAAQILDGASETLASERCCLVGGHSLDDPEIKLGFAVTGTVAPGSIITNRGAREGDLLYLTKPLGTGIAATALKGDLLEAGLLAEVTRWMRTSNRAASLSARACRVSAATDVTGFGLLGHLLEMCHGAGTGAVLEVDRIPVMDGIAALADSGLVPAGAYANRRYIQDRLAPCTLAESTLLPLFDPQTSGGLLMAIPPDRADLLEVDLAERGCAFWRIGCMVDPPEILTLASERP